MPPQLLPLPSIAAAWTIVPQVRIVVESAMAARVLKFVHHSPNAMGRGVTIFFLDRVLEVGVVELKHLHRNRSSYFSSRKYRSEGIVAVRRV
jgi:hypothetical protein